MSEEERRLLLEQLERQLDTQDQILQKNDLSVDETPVQEVNESKEEKEKAVVAKEFPFEEIPELENEKDPQFVDFQKFESEFGINENDYLSYSREKKTVEDQSELNPVKSRVVGLSSMNDDSFSRIPEELRLPGMNDVGDTVSDTVSEAVSEPISKPINEPVSKPVNEPVNKPVNIPINKPVNQPINKPTDMTSDINSSPVGLMDPSLQEPGLSSQPASEMNAMGIYEYTVENPIQRFHLMEYLCAFEEQFKPVTRLRPAVKKEPISSIPKKAGNFARTHRAPAMSLPVTKKPIYSSSIRITQHTPNPPKKSQVPISSRNNTSIPKPLVLPKKTPSTTQPVLKKKATPRRPSFSPVQNQPSIEKDFPPLACF